MIDIHSHIIPGIDDGADLIGTSIEMLNIAKQEGTRIIYATPHYYRGRYETSYGEILKQVDELKNNVSEIEIMPGQEIFLDKYTLSAWEEGKIGTLGGTRYMLLELPFDRLRGNETDIIYELRIKGIVPIVAHPERYIYIMEKPANINRFIEEGCLFQLNSGSIEGMFGREVKSTAELLIKNGLCSFIASDAHTSDKRRPGLNKAYECIKKIDKDIMEKVLVNSELLTKDEEIKPNHEKLKEKKSIFDIFK